MAEELASPAEELDHQAAELRRMVEGFKLREGSHSSSLDMVGARPRRAQPAAPKGGRMLRAMGPGGEARAPAATAAAAGNDFEEF